MSLKSVLESPRLTYSVNFCAFLFRLVRSTFSSDLIFLGSHGDDISANTSYSTLVKVFKNIKSCPALVYNASGGFNSLAVC